MTNKSLQLLLEKLNHNDESCSLIYRRPLSSNVDYAKIWLDKPKFTDNVTSSDGPDVFYLIKNNENTFVAIVFDMIRDLHWFVNNDFRGNGHLTKAMEHTIIPHLFLSRNEQRITIKEIEIGKDNFKASEKVALNLGFEKIADGEYLMLNHIHFIENYNFGKDTPLDPNRIDELKKQINFLGRSLWAIQTELEMKFDKTDYSKELMDLVNQIRSHTWKLDDFYWSIENKNKFI
ncbi:hypothetical protein C3729_12965 [Cloacibacterium normanense]|uniref:Uncharacterized protein n=1 Tax=Cloacibacterium normanense TaxID=237258 RepID=A0A2S7I1R4_9FLAO|nr:hypothetical protein [Cloacibacterium normanense]PPZ90522.1 hypothetical protein C3729_12965 [Cloacibacterium normanense]